MRWPWSRRDDAPPEVVTDDRLRALREAQMHLEQRQRQVERQRPMVDELVDFFQRENIENHLAQRLRRAMQGRL